MPKYSNLSNVVLVVALLLCLSACMKSVKPSAVDEGFVPLPESGQLPLPVVKEASKRYGGSYHTFPEQERKRKEKKAARRSTRSKVVRSNVVRSRAVPKVVGRKAVISSPISASPKKSTIEPALSVAKSKPNNSSTTSKVVSRPITVVLGPIRLVSPKDSNLFGVDAGQRVREILYQGITSAKGFALKDAPMERFVDDAPRPDLAKDGVNFVIKGVVSKKGGLNTLFLRAIDTASGKVSGIASGKHQDIDKAAGIAVKRLVERLQG